MALDIDSDLIVEKNKLDSKGVFLELLEIQLSEAATTVRYTSNNEDVIWGGHTWERFPFQPGPVDESADSDLPTVSIQVSNAGRVVQGLVEDADDGLVGDTVVLRLVHADYLADGDDAIYLEENYQILGVQCGIDFVTFTLGGENFYLLRFPAHTFRRNICRYEEFKGDECAYAGATTSCNRLFDTCITLVNSSRFGGQPGIPGGLFDVST